MPCSRVTRPPAACWSLLAGGHLGFAGRTLSGVYGARAEGKGRGMASLRTVCAAAVLAAFAAKPAAADEVICGKDWIFEFGSVDS